MGRGAPSEAWSPPLPRAWVTAGAKRGFECKVVTGAMSAPNVGLRHVHVQSPTSFIVRSSFP